MRLGASEALKTRQDSRKLGGFGKKWEAGNTLSVFYPIFKDANGQWDLLVAHTWGHGIDIKALPGLKRVFIPSNSKIVDGEPTTADALFQFSRIAPLFVRGEYNEKLLKIREKAAKLTESMLKQKEQELDKEFEMKDGRIQKSAAVGNLRLVISTEVVAVKHGDGGRPKIDEAGLVTQDLSDGRIRKLKQILSNPDMQIPDDAKYLEVTYTFGTSGIRQQDAQAEPVGTLPEYRIAKRFPQEWLALEGFIVSLPESSDTIMKRNSSYKPVEENKIIQAIQSYSVMNSELLDALSDDDDIDRLKRNARLLRSLSISVENEEVSLAIQADLEREQKEKELAALAKAAEQATNVEGVKEEQEQPPTLGELISQEEIESARTDESANTTEIGEGSPLEESLV